MQKQCFSVGNLILVDWCTVSFKNLDPLDVMDLLRISPNLFVHVESYRYGYKYRYELCGVNILWGGQNRGCCLDISGSGCRYLEESFPDIWYYLFPILDLMQAGGDCNVTRLDLAFDDHTDLLDIDRIREDTEKHHYTSRSQWWEVIFGSQGTTLYIGSPQSNFRLRIYDKAAERGYKSDEKHWVRVEMVLRDTNAIGAIRKILEDWNVGTVFCGILRNYVVFRDPTNDSNASRWPIADYWENLLGNVEAISVFTPKGTAYNLFQLQDFVTNKMGSCVRTYADIVGIDQLAFEITGRVYKRNPKQKSLLEAYNVKLETLTYFCSDGFSFE